MSFGSGVSGAKGYRIKGVDFANKILYLTTNEIEYETRDEV
jgi:hypothetical protein